MRFMSTRVLVVLGCEMAPFKHKYDFEYANVDKIYLTIMCCTHKFVPYGCSCVNMYMCCKFINTMLHDTFCYETLSAITSQDNIYVHTLLRST